MDEFCFPMTMVAGASERTKELAQQLLELIAASEANFSECGAAAMYVMAACVAQVQDDTRRANIIDGMHTRVARLVQANRGEIGLEGGIQ
jgi:hypothetical protein